MITILLVDDERDWLQGLGRTLHKYNIVSPNGLFTACDGASALDILSKNKIDLVMLDLYLENETGEDLLEKVMNRYPLQNVVMTTGSSSVEHAVNCMKAGAKDYFIKSTPVAELMENIRRIVKIVELEAENDCIKRQIVSKDSYREFDSYITRSPLVYSLFGYIKAIAESSQTILLTGESGVGKGIIAKIIGEILRSGKPNVSVNVASYDDQMFSDTLFGHIKGAFTGADSPRNGMIKEGRDGTIFLDEIGDLSLVSQTKLLCLIQDGEYRQLGSDKLLKSEAKFIFATNQDLTKKLRDKTFRRDLFFRLNTHCINIPPLRERPEDIPPLLSHFALEAARDFKKDVPVFTPRFVEGLKKCPFPGNIRELKSYVFDLAAQNEDIIEEKHLKLLKRFDSAFNMPDSLRDEQPAEDGMITISDMTNIMIKKAMEKAGGNQIKAAKLLGISQPTLSRKLKDNT